MGQEITTRIMLRGMDSREIAQLTSKEHRNVCRDIQGMLAELQIDRLRFESAYKAGNGEMRRCYVLPKRECLILATGYNVGLRAKIIDRWAELEAAEQARQRQAPVPAPQHKIPQTYADALQLAADQARQIDAQAKQIQAAQPAVEFVDRYVAAKTTQSLRAVAASAGSR